MERTNDAHNHGDEASERERETRKRKMVVTEREAECNWAGLASK